MNYIKVNQHKTNKKRKQVTSSHSVFKLPFVVTVSDDKIQFTEYTIDNPKEPLKPIKASEGYYQVSVYDYRLPCGKFEIDEEESEEGKIVVYYEDLIK